MTTAEAADYILRTHETWRRKCCVAHAMGTGIAAAQAVLGLHCSGVLDPDTLTAARERLGAAETQRRR